MALGLAASCIVVTRRSRCLDARTAHVDMCCSAESAAAPDQPACAQHSGALHGACGCRRLHFCDAGAQRRGFEAQLGLARHAGLPLFLHMRAAAADFVDIMRRSAGGGPGVRAYRGVVHSFTGTVEELGALLALQPPLAIGAPAWPHQANGSVSMRFLAMRCDACL